MGPGRKKIEELEARLHSLGVKREDIEEKFVRSSGKGGQNVNKVATCVCLKHTRTGITVKYGGERSQNLNRFLGLRLLADKIETELNGTGRVVDKIEKIRRQKKRRKRRSRSKITKE